MKDKLKELLEELKGYNFECQAGPLENCDAFMRLEELANE